MAAKFRITLSLEITSTLRSLGEVDRSLDFLLALESRSLQFRRNRQIWT